MLTKTILIKLSQASVLLPVVAGLVHYKKLDKPFKILFYFFVISIGFEIQATICKNIFRNNMPGMHLYTLVEFLAFSTVYYLQIRKNSIARRLLVINTLLFVGIAIIDAIFIDGIKNPNDLSRGYSFISLSVYTLIYFFDLFQKDDTKYVWEYPMFWVSTGALIYFAGNTLYFMLKGYLLNNAANIEAVSNVAHAVLNIIAYFLYAQSFRCLKHRKTFS